MNKRLSIITILLVLVITATACGNESKKVSDDTATISSIEISSSEVSTTVAATEDINKDTTETTTSLTENITDDTKSETIVIEAATNNTTETTTNTKQNNNSNNINNNTSTNKDKNNNSNNKNDNKNDNNTNNITNSNVGDIIGEKDPSKLTQTTTNSSSSEEKTLAQNIVNQIITKNMSEFDKAKTIHDYIIMNVDYDYANYLNDTIPSQSYKALGALKYKYAVCAGYAKTFQLLCQLAGLECTYVTGDTPSGSHAWNQVKIDGKWYNVDTTWDDPVSLEKKFDDHRYNRYSYFLISDELMYKDHTPKTKVQTCSSSLIQKAYEVGSPWQDSTYTRITNESELRTAVKKVIDANSTSFNICFDSKWKSFNDMKNMVSGMMYEFVRHDFSFSWLYHTDKNTTICNVTVNVNLQNGKYTKLNRINTIDDLKVFVKSLTTGECDQETVAVSNNIANDKNFYDVATWAFDTLDVTMGVFKTEIYVSSEASAYHIYAFENTYHGSHHGNKAYDAKKASDILPILSEHYNGYESFRVIYRYGDEIGRLSTEEIEAYVAKNLAPTWQQKYCFSSYRISVEEFVCVMEITFHSASHNTQGMPWVESPAPTCIKGGTSIKKCSVCNNVVASMETEPTGVHDTHWVYDSDINKHLECKNCTYKGTKLQLYGQVWGYFDDNAATEFFNDVNKLRETTKYIERDYMGNFVAAHDLPQLSWNKTDADTLRTYAVCQAFAYIDGSTAQKLDNALYYQANLSNIRLNASAYFYETHGNKLLENMHFSKACTVHFCFDSDGTGLKMKQITCIVFSE